MDSSNSRARASNIIGATTTSYPRNVNSPSQFIVHKDVSSKNTFHSVTTANSPYPQRKKPSNINTSHHYPHNTGSNSLENSPYRGGFDNEISILQFTSEKFSSAHNQTPHSNSPSTNKFPTKSPHFNKIPSSYRASVDSSNILGYPKYSSDHKKVPLNSIISPPNPIRVRSSTINENDKFQNAQIKNVDQSSNNLPYDLYLNNTQSPVSLSSNSQISSHSKISSLIQPNFSQNQGLASGRRSKVEVFRPMSQTERLVRNENSSISSRRNLTSPEPNTLKIKNYDAIKQNLLNKNKPGSKLNQNASQENSQVPFDPLAIPNDNQSYPRSSSSINSDFIHQPAKFNANVISHPLADFNFGSGVGTDEYNTHFFDRLSSGSRVLNRPNEITDNMSPNSGRNSRSHNSVTFSMGDISLEAANEILIRRYKDLEISKNSVFSINKTLELELADEKKKVAKLLKSRSMNQSGLHNYTDTDTEQKEIDYESSQNQEDGFETIISKLENMVKSGNDAMEFLSASDGIKIKTSMDSTQYGISEREALMDSIDQNDCEDNLIKHESTELNKPENMKDAQELLEKAILLLNSNFHLESPVNDKSEKNENPKFTFKPNSSRTPSKQPAMININSSSRSTSRSHTSPVVAKTNSNFSDSKLKPSKVIIPAAFNSKLRPPSYNPNHSGVSINSTKSKVVSSKRKNLDVSTDPAENSFEIKEPDTLSLEKQNDLLDLLLKLRQVLNFPI
ncbi:hypothetical protein AYI68_g2613 [Smittium mucronatum]|uniref:Uncharacterized protein n=1 Tax=Smittium mucronatum TaxID=133383 RepID=A0A1R0H281_9FUNG|nr:hypothetical protein AYI68_g2613 [Smittium mucronatum]